MDEAAVLRRMAGDKDVNTTPAEKAEVIRRLTRAGHSHNWIQQHTGINCPRYAHLLEAAG